MDQIRGSRPDAPARSARVKHGLLVASPYLRTFIKLLVGSGLLFQVYMWCQYFWYDGFYRIFGASMAKLGIVYPYGKAYDIRNPDSYDSFYVLFLWMPLGGGALLTILAQRLPNHTKPLWMKKTQALGRRVMQLQIPPRRFFIYWCDGMSVLDALMLAVVTMLNLMWFIIGMNNFNDEYRALDEAGIVGLHPTWQRRLEWAGLYFGVLLFIDVWLLLIPVPQSSFIQDLTGLDYHQMIRWHRWMGHITLIVTSLHGILYYVYWGVTHQFWYMFADWGKTSYIINLAGSISWFFGLALWLTSMNWCRRWNWEVYYHFHMVGFVGFMLFAYIHYPSSWIYFTPGKDRQGVSRLLLWFVDLVMRSGSFKNTTTVANCGVNETEDVVTLQIQGSKRTRGCPVHDIYLLFPAISRWQWHPFTISQQSADGMLTVRIKKYGDWTQTLLSKLKSREPMAIRASCPPYGGPHQWRQDEVVVVLAGGIASTSVLRVLSDLAARRAQGKGPGPRRVFFVWTARKAVEFCVMDLAVAAASMDPDGWMTTSLFYTGKEPLLASDEHQKLDTLEKLSSRGSDSGSDTRPGVKLSGKPLTFPLASPYWWNKARKLQPQAFGPIHLALVTALVFFSGFVGHFLIYSWYAEWYTHYSSSGEEMPWNSFYWRVGALDAFGFCAIALGMPYLMAVFLPGLYRYWQDTRAGSTTDELMDAFTGAWDPSSMGCELAGNGVVIPGSDMAIPILAGRPDFSTILQTAAKETGARHIGVYVAGPDAMSQSAHLAICKLNDVWRGEAYYDFHKMAGYL